MRSPIQILEKELYEYEKALDKSIKLYEKGDIDLETHLVHKKNLKHLIEQFTYAIYKLKK
jgi:hypothetical protein